jgi:hypothetical protein
MLEVCDDRRGAVIVRSNILVGSRSILSTQMLIVAIGVAGVVEKKV